MSKNKMQTSYGDSLTIARSAMTGGCVVECTSKYQPRRTIRICFWTKFKLRIFIKHLQSVLDKWEADND